MSPENVNKGAFAGPVRTVSVHATVSAVASTMPPFPSALARRAFQIGLDEVSVVV